jgi:RNA polymerase sigma factor for flagellar operon FliA
MNSLKAYQKNAKPVNKDSESSLWKAYISSRNHKLHEQLVEMYLPFVYKEVSRQSIRVRQKIEKDELVSAGVIGLHNAVAKFKPEQGNQFSTFAVIRIKGAIIDELRKQDHLTRNQRKHYRTICETIQTLTNELGHMPEMIEIAKNTNLTEAEVREYIGMASNALSIDGKNKQGVSYSETLQDEKSQEPWENVDQSLSIESMREAFKLLPKRDQQLIYLRHYKDMRSKEIALTMNISEGRVSQLYKEIIVKLRAIMNVSD